MQPYKKLLIQQCTYDGSSYNLVGSAPVDTQAEWNVVCQEFPFRAFPEAKDLPKRDWADENGEDIFVPVDGAKFKAYDVDVTFLYTFGSRESYSSASSSQSYDDWLGEKMKQDIGGFINFLYGRNGGSPLLYVYDEYLKIGRRGIYVSSVSSDLYFYNDVNIQAVASFKVKFRVTDPVTEVQYSNGAFTVTGNE